MSEELEQSGTDVNPSEAPSAPSEETSSSKEPAAEATSSESKKENYVPYDRFKELVEQKNQFAKQFEETQSALKDLRERMEKQSKPAEVSAERKLIERLKGIDPEFGTWAEQQEAARSQLQEMATKYQQLEAEKTRTEVQSSLDKLHGEYKVPKEAQDLYRALIKEQATSNPNLGIQDLPRLYKQVHDSVSKFLEGQKRAALNTYAAAKTTDSKVPKAQKGPAPKLAQKFEYSKDREEAKAQMVKRTMELLRNNES